MMKELEGITNDPTNSAAASAALSLIHRYSSAPALSFHPLPSPRINNYRNPKINLQNDFLEEGEIRNSLEKEKIDHKVFY